MAKSNFIQEFKDFVMKGNVIDMAVGVIIGGAFGKIVSSLVGDIVMPLIGLLLGGFDFNNLKWILKPASKAADGTVIEAVTLNYGTFIQNTVDFLIIAFSIFLVIKGITKLRRKKEEKPVVIAPVQTKEEILLTEIRDLLKEKAGK